MSKKIKIQLEFNSGEELADWVLQTHTSDVYDIAWYKSKDEFLFYTETKPSGFRGNEKKVYEWLNAHENNIAIEQQGEQYRNEERWVLTDIENFDKKLIEMISVFLQRQYGGVCN